MSPGIKSKERYIIRSCEVRMGQALSSKKKNTTGYTRKEYLGTCIKGRVILRTT